MRQTKKPTRSQRDVIRRSGLDTYEYLVVQETKEFLKVIQKGKSSDNDVVTLKKIG